MLERTDFGKIDRMAQLGDDWDVEALETERLTDGANVAVLRDLQFADHEIVAHLLHRTNWEPGRIAAALVDASFEDDRIVGAFYRNGYDFASLRDLLAWPEHRVLAALRPNLQSDLYLIHMLRGRDNTKIRQLLEQIGWDGQRIKLALDTSEARAGRPVVRADNDLRFADET